MPLYRFKALTPTGQLLQGEMEADTERMVISRLRDDGNFPIGAEPATPRSRLRQWLEGELTRRSVSGRDIALFTREFATLVGAGVSLDRVLGILVGLAERPALRRVVTDIHRRVEGGASIADALEAHPEAFAPFYVNMIRAGEAGGQLGVVLARLAEFLERSRALSASLRSALIYPAVLVAMAGLSLVVVLTVVLPEFEPIFAEAGRDLPFATQVVRASGQAVRDYWWIAAAIGLIGYLVIRRDLTTPEGRFRWHGVLLSLPLFGNLRRKLAFARFARMLGTLLSNGVGVLQAMALAREVTGNEVIKRALITVASKVQEGGGLARPLAEAGIFPRLASDLISVGEESGHLEEMLLKAADIYDDEVKRTIDRAMTLLVPILTIGLGALIAAIIGSVLVAILSVNELAL
ncbi:MAG: type II secretion system F family protein [Alphaproteobacteria bacterium]|nr:type II secretion system F family protein [Alphaproteobacteria bacterium]